MSAFQALFILDAFALVIGHKPFKMKSNNIFISNSNYYILINAENVKRERKTFTFHV